MSFAISVPAHAFSEVHTVTFFENVNGSDPVSALETANAPQPLTLIENLDPSFSNPGYTFLGWNTSINDSGTPYADGSTYSFTADAGLYAQWLPIPVGHNVTFFENANATDSVTAMQAAGTPQNLMLMQNLDPSFSNPGYTFLGWNTLANGGGTSYADGSTYSFDADIGLYAQWAATTAVHTLTLYENDSASDSITSTMLGSITSSITPFSSLQPTFSYAGHSFVGWNTSANGSGTSYADGEQYSFGSNAGLYAQWTPDTYAVTYSYDGGVATLNSANFIVGTTALILPTPTFNGNIFNGWFSEVVGGTLIGGGGSSFVPTNSIQLFAQWTPTLIVVLTFSSNGGTGSIASLSGNDGATAFLPTSDGMTKLGYAFNGWNTQADGTGTQYAEGVGLTLTGSQTFYAQWTAGQSDTVTFNANGGSGSINPINGISGSTITLPGQSGLIHAGFALSNWNTSANGSGTSYSIGIGFKLAGSIILYAQWSGHEPVTLFGAIGTFKSGTSSLSAALKSQINRVALTIRARKYLKVDLYGYTAETGLKSLNLSLSRDRAINVAIYLRNRLHALKVRGVSISSSGQGSISGQSSNAYSRVEVFGV
jgi:uncharacterized repeat protein (TIGR02543 family)